MVHLFAVKATHSLRFLDKKKKVALPRKMPAEILLRQFKFIIHPRIRMPIAK